VPMVSQSTVQSAAQEAGLAPAQVDAVVAHYSDAQIEALKRALFVASMFVLVGVWFARALPGEPLGSARSKARAGPPALEPAPSA